MNVNESMRILKKRELDIGEVDRIEGVSGIDILHDFTGHKAGDVFLCFQGASTDVRCQNGIG